MTANKVFFDTNIWIYLAIQDKDSDKHKLSVKFLKSLSDVTIYTSVQAINEFQWVLSRKFKIPENEILEKIENGILSISDVFSLNIQTYRNAYKLRETYNISFWDSLMVASALNGGCQKFVSEDLQNNQIFENSLSIVNPFGK